MSTRYRPGDAIVHAVHGPGTVAGVEERQVAGRTVTYLKVDIGSMVLLVPEDDLESSGLRAPMEADVARSVLLALEAEVTDDDPGHTDRRRINATRLSSGDPEALADVLRTLEAQADETGKGLLSRDRDHHRQALEMLAGEIAIALGITEAEALERIRAALPGEGPA